MGNPLCEIRTLAQQSPAQALIAPTRGWRAMNILNKSLSILLCKVLTSNHPILWWFLF